jgi:hypothetical protein
MTSYPEVNAQGLLDSDDDDDDDDDHDRDNDGPDNLNLNPPTTPLAGSSVEGEKGGQNLPPAAPTPDDPIREAQSG